MAKTNWEKIKHKYITTDVSYRELADEFSLSEDTVRRRAAKEKWKNERHKHNTNVTQKISDTTAEAIAKDYENICEKAREELNALMELNTKIRLGFTEKDQWAEKRVSTCIDNVTKIITQMEKLRYPEHDKQTQEITVVMPQKLKEFSE